MEILNNINIDNPCESAINKLNKEISNNNSLNSTNLSISINSELPQKFYIKNSSEIRISYMNKLFNNKIPPKNPSNNLIKRKYNSMIFFDWDDTLLCSTFLIEKENKNLNKKHISQLENIVYNLLQLSLNYGDTYIITNASKNWVLYSSMIYFPKIIQLFNKIKIISARDAYEKNFPNNNKFWKLAVFMDITNLYNKNLITNIISIGDSLIENEAAFKLSSIFSECYIKTIKIQEESKPELLLKQLKLILKQFNFFHSSVRNISVKIEKNNIKL